MINAGVKAGRVKGESGAVLILVLVFALLLNIVAASVIQSATLQTRMAGNDQAYVESRQLAEGFSRSVLLDPNNFPLDQEVNAHNCLSHDVTADCKRHSLNMSAELLETDNATFRTVVTRRAPEVLAGEVVELDSNGNAALVPFDIALFEIQVEMKGSVTRARHMRLRTGVAVPLDGSTHWVSYQSEPFVDAL